MRIFRRNKPYSVSSQFSAYRECQSCEHSTLDRLLKRLGYISQFGLFLVTILTIYFTVIPLYQKALLDEAIAKKEIEIQKANATLEKTYTRFRDRVLIDFVYLAGLDCSGLMLPTEKPLSPFQSEQKESKSHPELDKVFAIDVVDCVSQLAKKYQPFSELRKNDREYINRQIGLISPSLVSLKQKAVSEYTSVESRISTSPESIPPPGESVLKMLEILSKYESPIQHKQTVIDALIGAEKSRIVSEYGNMVREKILLLKKVDEKEGGRIRD